ncbi:MAG: hypothetical protein IJQ82_10185, partial [Selenomonadaceae bacterium]|nr:hypothetical protein [Selenomonadaceae bacterium]
TQLLEMQRDRLTLATAAYQDYAGAKNANEVVAKRLETAMERERLAVARLEAQLKSLSAQRISINTAQLQDGIAKLNAKIQQVKIRAEIDTSKLQGAAAIFYEQKNRIAAVTKELELQWQKLIQLREAMYQSAKNTGGDSVQTLNIKSNVLEQMRQIAQLETRLKELQGMNISLNFRTDSLRQIEATINENIARINARIEDIRVKTDIDVSKLGAAASEFDKAKIQLQGLNRELDLQNQKLAEMKHALGTSIKVNGLDSVKTINLQTEIQKQIQAIDQLKAKISELNKIEPPKTNSLLSGYLSFKGNIVEQINNIAMAFSNLQGATSSADNAIVATLGVIGNIPHPVGRAVAAFAAMPIVLKGVESSIVDLTQAVAATGDSTYVMSRGFQMSLADTGKFTAMCKTAGVEVNDLASTIRRTQQQIIRGGEDSKPERWLNRYGESAFDASGHLKNLNDMTLTLSRALKRAQAEGNGMNFILGTMRSASADAITAIEDAEDVYKQAAGLIKNGLIDAKFAHEVQGNINAMNLQTKFMNAAFESALLPVANEIIPRLKERMDKLTQVIADNKDMIRDLGRTTAEAFLKIESAAETVGKTVGTIGRAIYDFHKDPYEKTIVEKYKFDTNLENVDDLIKKEQNAAYDIIKSNPLLYQQARQKYEPIFQALKDVQEEIKRKNEAIAKELESINLSGADFSPIGQERRQIEQNPEILETLRRARKYQEEAETILYKMNHGDFANRRRDVDVWWNQLVREGEKSNKELEALTKEREAKLAQIEKEYTEKIAGYYKNAADVEYKLTHTAFEKQIRDIELWKEAQREKAETAKEIAAVVKEAAMKEAEAFEREVDRIKNLTQSLEDEIFEMENSQYEADKRRALQKAQRALDEGVDVATVQRFLQDKFGQLDRRADESRRSGGDYTKAPEGARQFGGNGIIVLEADQIIDDGLFQGQQQAIGLFTDENRIRQQLLPKLDEDARLAVERIQTTKELTAAQQDLIQSTQQGFQLIEGDKFAQPTAGDFQVMAGDQVLEMPTQELQQFSEAVQQMTAPLNESADAQKSFAEGVKDFPPEYFKNLADSAKGVSETQMLLTDSTLGLIDAQKNLADALKNLPTTKQEQNISNNQPLPTDGFMQLSSSTQDVRKEQDLLARTTRETDARLKEISDIPPRRQQDEGFTFKPGFDYDTAKDIFLTGVGLSAAAAGTGVGLAFSPEILAGSLLAAGVGGVLKGSVDETATALNLPDEKIAVDLSTVETSLASIEEKIQSLIQADEPKQSEINFEELITPLTSIDEKFQSLLQSMQEEEPRENDRLQELLGTLPDIAEDVKSILLALQRDEESSLSRVDKNPVAPLSAPSGENADYLTPLMSIDGNLQSILRELQSPAEEKVTADYSAVLSSIDGKVQSVLQAVQARETISLTTVITPLDGIKTLVGNILTVLNNRKPAQITVSPNNNIDLGGAYVFDNALKQQLVNDITKEIVEEITTSVRQAISQSSYGYSA